jgi:hypothetical protein
MGRKVTSLKKTNQFWNMPLTSFLHHLIIRLNLRNMAHKCVNTWKGGRCHKLNTWYARMWAIIHITIVQIKVPKLTQTCLTPFKDEIFGNSWWCWF